jgi:hypothetical protein
MSSISEVGHPKNVAALANLITYCTSYGTTYNPSNSAIKLNALNTLENNAQNALTNVINFNTANTNAINARIVAFLNIKKLATRLLSALIASGATAQQKANAKTINRKIQGNRAKIVPVPTPTPVTPNTSNTQSAIAEKSTTPPSVNPVTPTPAPHTISTSQRSFDNLIQHMQAFIALLQSIPSYNPNEVDLKITSLNTYLATLNSTNAAAIVAHTNANNARIARNKILYTNITGLCDIGEEVKEYIKSVYGSSSPEYKQVRSIKFKKQKL